ncbi:TetR family transcriptional regulator [Nocardioides mangrovicus]|uniref:TetR family transcriptional regulator n=2 Tax=Nocardioides mangrovicus TaxID=2478913 RepID=A0A3L8P6Y8_9ACTN|nr:TetR family transcriptional regulator [Nocardioides mangrovicus]
MESVITEAVAILDEAGSAALTFRALAGRLGGGVASIYWYVDNKEELLDRATDHVIGDVLGDIARREATEDPIEDLRTSAVMLFDAVTARPWLASYLLRNTDLQPNALRLYEHLGQQVMRLDLPPRETFHALSAVIGYVIGTAADLGQQPPAEVLEGQTTREEYLGRYAERWRESDPQDYPFLHYVVEEFDGHQDADQFSAGLDLVLAGLRLQADR